MERALLWTPKCISFRERLACQSFLYFILPTPEGFSQCNCHENRARNQQNDTNTVERIQEILLHLELDHLSLEKEK